MYNITDNSDYVDELIDISNDIITYDLVKDIENKTKKHSYIHRHIDVVCGNTGDFRYPAC